MRNVLAKQFPFRFRYSPIEAAKAECYSNIMEGHRSTRIRIATNVLSALRHYREPNPEDVEYLRQFDPRPGERPLSEDELAYAVIETELALPPSPPKLQIAQL
jgi:hypothetical protein